MIFQNIRLANLVSVLLLSLMLYSPIVTGATINEDTRVDTKINRRADPTLTADAIAALKIQNDGRKSKNLSELVWDPKLVAHAQEWASYLASISSMKHSTSAQRPGEGENLGWAWTSAASGIINPMSGAAQGWMNEAKVYNNETIPNGNFAGYGHYTQCMWRNTQSIGMAFATAKDGGVYTVARYSPPGNYVGQRPY